MEENHNTDGNLVEKHENPSEPAITAPRTALDEIRKVPLVADGVKKVSVVHERLTSIIPLYGFITSFILQTSGKALSRMKGLNVFQWTVELCDCIMLGIIDFMRSSFPVITLPTQELFGKVNKYARRKVSAVASHVASYSLSQRIFKLLENVLSKLEIFVSAFTVNEERRMNIPWWYAPNLVLAAYESTVSSAMMFGERQLCRCRHAIRSVRKSGAKSNDISHRRKVSPRKSCKRERQWIGYRFLAWLKNKFYSMMGHPTDMASGFSCDSSLDDTPNNEIASQEKKRKLSDVEEEESSDSDKDLTYHALMTSFSSYNSKEDPDYLPSEPSTDSYEYRFSSEEDCSVKSALGSPKEANSITNGKGQHDSSKNSIASDADEPVLLRRTQRNTKDLEQNGSVHVHTESNVQNAENKDEQRPTSTPEAKRKGILRW